MKRFSADYLRQFGTDFFVACGSPRDEAAQVADHLAESNLMGYDSHGIVRITDYVICVKDGRVRPGAPMTILKETPSTAIVDCGLNFGQVSANLMIEIAYEKAKTCGISSVVSQSCFHIGRLGSHVQKIAERGMFALMTCNGRQRIHMVVPWGGRDGRLGTNPIAFAAPTKGWPVVMDFSTCMIPEGKIRLSLFEGKPIPENCIQDPEGNSTTDAARFYTPDRNKIIGTILPLGAPRFGHKGYGLALMTEIMGAILSGEDATVDHNRSNGVSLMVINPDAFCGIDLFTELVDRFCQYQMSSRPAKGFSEVVVPGTLDFRTREKRLVEGILFQDSVWAEIVDAAAQVGLKVSEP
jgi:hydroxycarboxylate dehydrogenase B